MTPAASGGGRNGHGAAGAAPGTFDGLIAAKEIVIACGPGGVGKTTTAAATAAMAAYHLGGRVLVLTIDVGGDPVNKLSAAMGDQLAQAIATVVISVVSSTSTSESPSMDSAQWTPQAETHGTTLT